MSIKYCHNNGYHGPSPVRRERQKAGLPFFGRENIDIMGKDSFVIEITSGWISRETRKALQEIIMKHQGDTELLLWLSCPETGYRIQFRSCRYRVNVCDALVADLEKVGVTIPPEGLLPGRV